MRIGGVGPDDTHAGAWAANDRQRAAGTRADSRAEKSADGGKKVPPSEHNPGRGRLKGGEADPAQTGAAALEEKLKGLFARGRKWVGRLWMGPAETAGMEAVNPQEAPAGVKSGADTLWQRFKLKVYTATGYLAKRFGRGDFLQTDVRGGQNGQRENSGTGNGTDSGTKSNDSAAMDRSYLMDSYDRTGRYVRIGQQDGQRKTYGSKKE